MSHYDLIIIGSGPSGRAAAMQAGKLKRKVLVVERGRKVGGVSVHSGTIPSKTLRETIMNLSGYRERSFYGRAHRAKDVIKADDLRQRLVKTLNYEVDNLENMFARNHVDIMHGEAHFTSKSSIEVIGEDEERITFTADRFLIATGTVPFRPDYIPFNGSTVLDSDDVIELKRLPRSMIVIGAGVIGVEYATMMQALDVKVTLIEPRKTFLDFIDSTLIQDFSHEIRDMGLDLRLGCKVTSVVDEGDQIVVQTDNGRRACAEMLLFAAGRMGATQSLNLAACELETDHRGRIEVAEKTYQTKQPHIYATGDVIGFPSLASTSLSQGRIASCHAFGEKTLPESPWFPYGIYSVPEISTCGMSEEELQERGIPYEVGIGKFRETSRGNIMGIEHGVLKMLVSLKTRRILGVQIMGEGATELIHIGQAVMNHSGTVDYFIENTFNYPTLAEAYKAAGFDAWQRMPKPEMKS
ncbi:NAD(P)(+) transhydrogenase [Amylibacter kogurei]|uniref:Soluble pyridine nucleotide transhydrogenase n=1 Tax=Paramylibacter kogurei TaxID=1889778 RepID=A0A2G5KCU8_9RHOB|nr:Si-specific NAD(P)(+) transhydrogenase [Amylibacter kogurei]PIB26660.1 NAD(P)(+) transhydrogenase [Amylibacter kogurei]